MKKEEFLESLKDLLEQLGQFIKVSYSIEELEKELLKNFWRETHKYFPNTLEMCETNHKIIDNALTYYARRIGQGVIPIALSKDDKDLEAREEEFKDKKALYEVDEDKRPPFTMEKFEKIFGEHLEPLKQGIPQSAFDKMYLEWIEEAEEDYKWYSTKQNYELAIRSAIYDAMSKAYSAFITSATSLQIRYCDWYVCYIATEITFDISDMTLYGDDQTNDLKKYYARFDWSEQ